MEDTVEVVARAIFNASLKSVGRSVLWTAEDVSWPTETIRDEARQCARAAIAAVGGRVAELETAMRQWREHNGCIPSPDGVYIMVPARHIGELLDRK
jgi:hypothetical protein